MLYTSLIGWGKEINDEIVQSHYFVKYKKMIVFD